MDENIDGSTIFHSFLLNLDFVIFILHMINEALYGLRRKNF